MLLYDPIWVFVCGYAAGAQDKVIGALPQYWVASSKLVDQNGPVDIEVGRTGFAVGYVQGYNRMDLR